MYSGEKISRKEACEIAACYSHAITNRIVQITKGRSPDEYPEIIIEDRCVKIMHPGLSFTDTGRLARFAGFCHNTMTK